MRSTLIIRSTVTIGGVAVASFLLLGPGESQQAKALVMLQATTPGVAQAGNLSISGTGLFGSNVGIGLTNPSVRLDVNGQIRCTGFRLNSSGGVGKVLTSDASGIGSWQSLPADSLTLPYSGTASSGSVPLLQVTNTGDSPCIRGNSSAPTGTGVQGINSVSTGTGIGLYGEALSANGYGVVGHGSAASRNSFGRLGSHYDAVVTTDLNLGAGVTGESINTGVYGKGGSGPGVSGENQNWIAVGGWTNSGYGVMGSSNTTGVGVIGQTTGASGVGVEARGSGISSLSQGTALSINQGAIAVPGAGLGTFTPVFIHRATAGNTSGQVTVIDNPLTNGDPSAILIVTQNWNPGGVGGTYNTHPIGVFYNGSRWAIFNEDLGNLTVNAAFNVLVFKAPPVTQGDEMGAKPSMLNPNP